LSVTTPDTAAVRAWARENGYQVADRGRLRPEVLDAYDAAQRTGGTATKKKAAPAAKPARKAASVKAAPASKAPAKKVNAATPEPEPAAPAAANAPEPKPQPVADDRRLVALGEELAALTERVAQLEAQLRGKGGNGKTPRFRRSK
jgi:hypothetical protein